MKAKILQKGAKTWIHTRGRTYQIQRQNLEAGFSQETESTDELRAPFSCKILKLSVKPGQKVNKGEVVVVVEAMKMEYSYVAPTSSTVKQVFVNVGQTVPEGTLFVELK